MPDFTTLTAGLSGNFKELHTLRQSLLQLRAQLDAEFERLLVAGDIVEAERLQREMDKLTFRITMVERQLFRDTSARLAMRLARITAARKEVDASLKKTKERSKLVARIARLLGLVDKVIDALK